MGEKSWGKETLIGHAPDLYTLKRLDMNQGATGPLQYHERKDETTYVASGVIRVHFDDGTGSLTWKHVSAGESVRFPPGQVHRVEAITNSVLYEASTPVFDDRCNVAHLYDDEQGGPQ